MRTGIAEMEKENLVMKKELTSMRALYNDAMGRVRSLENLLHNAESANESLQRKLEDHAFLRDECEAVVSMCVCSLWHSYLVAVVSACS